VDDLYPQPLVLVAARDIDVFPELRGVVRDRYGEDPDWASILPGIIDDEVAADLANRNHARREGQRLRHPARIPAPFVGQRRRPQAVDNHQRLNYNVVRIHQEPASPYMLDVADEMGLMIIDETAIRGSQSGQDWNAGHDNMVNHARALVLRDRNHPAVIRWSQNNEPNQSGQDSEQFEKDLYAAINGNDGTRPVTVEVGVDGNLNGYPGMTYANFAVIPHYVDGFGRYGEGLKTVNGRPDGEGEYIWPAWNNKQGFEWFATATLAKRGKNATDLRPYTLQPPGPLEQPADPARAGGVQPGGRGRPPVLVRLRRLGLRRHLPSAAGRAQLRPERHGHPQHHRLQRRPRRHFGGLHLDGAVVASGSTTLTLPLGSRVTQPVSFTTPANGNRVYLQLSTTKSGSPVFTDAVEYFNLAGSGGPAPGNYRIVNRNSGKPLAVAGTTADWLRTSPVRRRATGRRSCSGPPTAEPTQQWQLNQA
jgi:Glycosyl hydrolases family 2, TIM barrel domain